MVQFSDVIASTALLVSLGTAVLTYWFYRRQLALIDTQEELNRRLIYKSEVEAIEGRQADVGAKLIKLGSSKHRVKVYNQGKAVARNVGIEFPDGNNLIPDPELNDKFPMELLEPGDSVDLVAAVDMSTPRKQAVLLKWADDHSDNNEKTGYLTL